MHAKGAAANRPMRGRYHRHGANGPRRGGCRIENSRYEVCERIRFGACGHGPPSLSMGRDVSTADHIFPRQPLLELGSLFEFATC